MGRPLGLASRSGYSVVDMGYCFHVELYKDNKIKMLILITNVEITSVVMSKVSVPKNAENVIFYFDNVFNSFD